MLPNFQKYSEVQKYEIHKTRKEYLSETVAKMELGTRTNQKEDDLVIKN